MKQIYLTALIFLGLFSLAHSQAPQGINFQAIALDGSGNPVVNQAVSIRLSVLQGSATGAVLFSETHQVTTDAGGHFAVVIGSGANQSGTFSSINWGSGSKWLRSEMDITGGTNYIAVGNTRFMSVPYSLYSNSSASAGTIEVPDGTAGLTPVRLFDDSVYTVPAGKNLYVNSDHVRVDSLSFSNYMQTSAMTVRPFMAASTGQTVESDATGFLVDATVDWKSINLSCNPYTVPAGKIFVIVTQDSRDTTELLLNGIRLRRNLSLSFFKAGDVLSTTGPCRRGAFNVNGYLRNE